MTLLHNHSKMMSKAMHCDFACHVAGGFSYYFSATKKKNGLIYNTAVNCSVHFVWHTLIYWLYSAPSPPCFLLIVQPVCVLHMLDKRLDEIKNSSQPQSKRVTSDVLNSCKHYFSCSDGTRWSGWRKTTLMTYGKLWYVSYVIQWKHVSYTLGKTHPSASPSSHIGECCY